MRPTDAANIKLPTDGYVAPSDAERLLLGQSFGGHSGEQRPKPTTAAPTTVTPGGPVSLLSPVVPAPGKAKGKQVASATVAPGFSK